MESDSDKRQYKRVQRQFIIRFRIKSESLVQDDPDKWEVITTQDLSGGGMLLNYNKELACGTLLDIMINFLLLKQPIRCIGKVLRVQKSKNAPIYRMAVMFTEIDQKDKQMIDSLVQKIKE